MKILVINSGSSSLKYELFEMRQRTSLARGLLERIGEPGSRLLHHGRDLAGRADELVREQPVADHRAALRLVQTVLHETRAIADSAELYGIGHRVVHGGEAFQQPTLIDDQVLEAIRRQIPLAPLHNPANLLGIEVALAEYADVPQVAVFDTAFHHTLPPHAWHYALPSELYQRYSIRRYGFHGTSHQYVSGRAAELLGRPLSELNLIVLHLGNGASATAVRGGASVDTSMGFTPLEGLMMGTRCGDLDPAVIFFLTRDAGLSIDQIDALLNKDSGLRGVCGANDMREVLRRAAAGDPRAQLAVEMYCYRVKKYLGAYTAALGRVDAIVFTAGIGENSAEVRAGSCRDLDGLGIALDPVRNASSNSGPRAIHSDGSRVQVLVVPTDEELEIAAQTVACIRAARLAPGREPA